MAAGSHAGWHEFTPEMRFCRKCGRKVTLKEPGGLNMRGYPLKYVEHMDCERAALRLVRDPVDGGERGKRR